MTLPPSTCRSSNRALPRLRGDDGAILVEFALFAPVLVLLAMGVLEFGLIWRDTQSAKSAAASAARANTTIGGKTTPVVSGTQPNRRADYEALATLKASISDIPDSKLEKVIIYRANSASGTPTTACRNVVDAGGVSGAQGLNSGTSQCNVFFPAEINQFVASNGSVFSGTSCSGSAPDRFWCPTSRNITQGAPPDWVGIYVEIGFEWETGVFPFAPPTLRDHYVMRIEPAAS